MTSVVVPSIRRSGSYSLDQAPRTYAEAPRALTDQHEAAEAARTQVAEFRARAAQHSKNG